MAADKPRRSVFVYIPNGVNGMNWQVTQPGRGYELSPSLKPLEAYRDDFTVFSGLHHPNGLGQAHVCADTWLTGAKIDAQSARKYENSMSCDQLMAEVNVAAHPLRLAGIVDQLRHRPAWQLKHALVLPRWRSPSRRGQSAPCV